MSNKLIAAGIGLVSYGALVGWAVTADAYEKKMRSNQILLANVIDRQAGEIRVLQGLAMAQMNGLTAVQETMEESAPEDETVEEVSYDEQFRGETPAETRENLRSIITDYTHPEDVEAFASRASRTVEDNLTNLAPIVITKDEYNGDEEGEEYEKDTLTYYPAYRILVDEDGDEIENEHIDSTVGWRNLTENMGNGSDHPDIVYIRNRRMQKDFEVIQETDEEPPPYIRIGINRTQFEANEALGVKKFRRRDVD